MSTLCGVCTEQPPKYKCPSCELKYCSLGCFKKHKPTHETPKNQPSAQDISPSATDQHKLPEPTLPANVTAPPPTQSSQFSSLLTDPTLQALFRAHPDLRSQLRDVYTSTLEPDPDAQPRFSGGRGFRGQRGNFRGRGRGRGRGDSRPRGPWRQEVADKWAVERLMRLQAREGAEAQGVKDFVQIVSNIVAQDTEDPLR